MNYECKTIPGYEDYEVDTNGNVWSLKFGKRRKLKPGITIQGYLYVHLHENNKLRTRRVHRLVMLTFCGESDLQVNHIDGVKSNNTLINLEYCTASENVRHSYRTGLACNKGERHSRSKLTKKDVIEIKTAFLNPFFGINKYLARKYGVSPYTISDIKSGKRWAHVKLN
jgi:hypothetical protein